MASVGEGDCHKDPNFAVICSFFDKYGALLELPEVTYTDLQKYLEDSTNDVSKVLIDIHLKLLKRIRKSAASSERFEKNIIKFIHPYSEFDAWEVESYGYKHTKLETKLRILKNLMECQFDCNIKFKEKVNESNAEDMRFLPIGRDKNGQAYWYFLDKDMNLLVYKEEQDDEEADTWQLVCSDRQDLANLVNTLQNDTSLNPKEEDKISTSGSRSSKEGSPEKEVIKQEEIDEIKVKEETKYTTDCSSKDMAGSLKGTIKTEKSEFREDFQAKQTIEASGLKSDKDLASPNKVGNNLTEEIIKHKSENKSPDTAQLGLLECSALNMKSVDDDVSSNEMSAKVMADGGQDNSADKLQNANTEDHELDKSFQDTAVKGDKADISEVNDGIQDQLHHNVSQGDKIGCEIRSYAEQLIDSPSKENVVVSINSSKLNEEKNSLDGEKSEEIKLLNSSDGLLPEKTLKDCKLAIGLEDKKLESVINSQKDDSSAHQEPRLVSLNTPDAELALPGSTDSSIASNSTKDPPDKQMDMNDSDVKANFVPYKVTDAESFELTSVKPTVRNLSELDFTETVIKNPEEANEQKTTEPSKGVDKNVKDVVAPDPQVSEKTKEIEPIISDKSLDAAEDMVMQTSVKEPKILQKSLKDQGKPESVTDTVEDLKKLNLPLKRGHVPEISDLQTDADVPTKTREDPKISDVPEKTREDKKISDVPAETGEDPKISDVPAKTGEDPKITDVSAETGDDPKISDVPAKTGEDPKISDVPAKTGENLKISDVPAETLEDPKISDVSSETSENLKITDVPAKTGEDPKITDVPTKTGEDPKISGVPAKTVKDPKISGVPAKTGEDPKLSDVPAETVEDPKITDALSTRETPGISGVPAKIEDPEMSDIPMKKTEDPKIEVPIKKIQAANVPTQKTGDPEIADVVAKAGKDKDPLERPKVSLIDPVIMYGSTETEVKPIETVNYQETTDAPIDKDFKKAVVSLPLESESSNKTQESSTSQCSSHPYESSHHSKEACEVSQNALEVSASNDASEIVLAKESSHLNRVEEQIQSAASNTIKHLKPNDSVKEEGFDKLLSGSSSPHKVKKENDRSESKQVVGHTSVTPETADSVKTCSNTDGEIAKTSKDTRGEKSCSSTNSQIGNTEGSLPATEAMSALGLNGHECSDKLRDKDHHNEDALKTIGIKNASRNEEKQNKESENTAKAQGEITEPQSIKNTECQRNLKRAAPEPGSDEPIDSEPNGKRAKQAVKAQKTRGGRNAAARGRAARLGQGESETDDSETPLSQVRSRRQARTRKLNENLTVAKDQTKTEKENDNEDSAGDPTAGKRAKKNKPGSTSEMISEEEVTPAKKGRNHSQSVKPIKSAAVKRGKGGKKGTSTILSSNEEDAAGIRRSLRVRQLRARRPPTPSSPSEESEEEEEEEDEETENEDPHFLDASFTPEEESGDEEFKPTGRNYRRQAARTSQENDEEVVNDDTPCVKCGKYNHPEMILLCDKCDAGYHTACLRPPLMLIPDGDWFCPPCEHMMLVAKLLDCLQTLDNAKKKKDRLNKRQERLAFVGINISNILHGDQKTPAGTRGKKVRNEETADEKEGYENNETGSSSFDSEEEEPERVYRSERLALRQAQKRSRQVKHKVRKSHARSPEVEVLTKRTCRVRNNVSYQFKEFDDLISNAIEDDKPCRREKPPGISRGKDMSNILGASDEEDEKIRQRDGESGPPPVVKKRSKRKLTKLDSDEDPDDDSEEFKLSDEDDTDVSEAEEEEEEEDEGLKSSDSGDWKSKKKWSNSQASTIRPTRRAKNFVVDDEDYDSDENANKRRSTRNSNRGRIHYNDWESDETEEEEPSFSDYSSDEIVSKARRQRRKKPNAVSKRKVKSKGKKEEESNDTQSDSSIARKRKILRKLVKKRRKDDSESQDSDAKILTEKKKTPAKKVTKKSDSEESELTLEEDSEDDTDESPKFKKKNVLRSSDEEEEEKKEKVNDELAPVEVKPESTEPEVIPQKVEEEEEEQTETKIKTLKGKKGKQAKGKKRGETEVEENRVVPDATVPDKVRKVSGGSDKEVNEKSAPAMSTVVTVEKIKTPNRKQRGKIKDVTEESCTLRQVKKIQSENMNIIMDSARVVLEKLPSMGKKKKVPNFLDVPSGGEESDDQKPDKNPVASTVSQETPALKCQTIPPSGHQPQIEAHSQYRNFPYPGALPPQHNMHYAPRPAHYQYSSQNMPPFPQGPPAGAPPHHAGQPAGAPPHHAGQPAGGPPHHAGQPRQSMSSPPAQPKTMGDHSHCIPTSPGYQGSVPRHPSMASMGAMHQMRQVHPGYNGGSGANPSPHHYQSGIGQGHQNLEPGQIPSNVNQHMAHTGFPMSSNGQPPPHTPGRGGTVMGQQSTVGMKPGFHMGQQNNDVNYQQSYGPGRMPSPRELGPGAIRHPYYAMQATPQGIGQHYSAHYPPGASHKMSSPLSSMGQMAKNLGQGPNLQSTPPVVSLEGTRHQPMVSPPHQDIKQENEDARSEGSEGDHSKKSSAKEGKKRGAPSKGRSKTKAINCQNDMSQQSPMTGSKVSKMSNKDQDSPLELNEGASMKVRPGVPSQEQGAPSHMGPFRPPTDSPYNTAGMPSYQMPYIHQSMSHMPAKPYITASSPHGPSVPSNQAKGVQIKPEVCNDGVANVADNQVPSKPALSPNEQRLNIAYQSKGQSANEPQCNSGQSNQAHEPPMPYSHRPGLSLHLQGSNQAHGPYYPGPYYQPYGGQPMPSHNSWAQNVSPYGPRMGPHIYQYGMNSDMMSHAARMPSGTPPHSKQGSHEPPQAANPNISVQKANCEVINSQASASGSKPGPEKRSLSTDSQPEGSDQVPRDISKKVLDGNSSKNAENKLVKEIPCTEDAKQSSPSSSVVPPSTLSAPSSTQNADKQANSSSAPSSLAPTTALQTSPDAAPSVLGKHQTSPTVNMAQQNTWTDPNVSMHYQQQMGGPWPPMNDPGQYGMMRPYGPPGMMGNPHYPGVNKARFEHQPPHNKMQMGQNPGHMEDRMMGPGHFLPPGYPGYDSGYQPPHGRPIGPGSDYHGMPPRPGLNSEQTCPPSYRPQSNESSDSNSHRGEVSQERSSSGNQARDDSVAETSAAPKPKRAKTNKKSKDGAPAGRIRAGKGRGRGRGGFMIDNLLQARSVEGDDEGEDSGEMKDIVSYVTTDDYFKQQTSS
ncbi:unnamed protein product [Lymnaea stagnalis]|uniref:PHD-type domain-containing protein n=1 Tax=Lymnaea stagnalis TaxID=6523 RepID=A0AAV2I9D7_LYMST